MTDEKACFNTTYYDDRLGRSEDVDDFLEVISDLPTARENWKDKISDILNETGYNQRKMAELCGVSRQIVNEWRNKGVIPKRGIMIKIGLAAGYDRDGINQLLTRYGRYHELYSKILEDSICLYVLNQNLGDGEKSLQKYNFILEKINNNVCDDAGKDTDISTKVFDEKLSRIHDDDELEEFIKEQTKVMSGAYHKLNSYIELYLEKNFIKGNLHYASDRNQLADEDDWSASLISTFVDIKHDRWRPGRRKLISVGMHLCMDRNMINDLLGLAHMAPLYPKDIFDAAVIYILEYARLEDIFLDKEGKFASGDFCDFVRGELEQIVGKYKPEVPEISKLLNDFQEKKFEEYENDSNETERDI